MTKPTNTSARKTGWRVVFAGTGGQGVITAARLLTNFFSERGNHVVSGQLHGMAQRGGSVQASVMVDCGISPVVPAGAADAVVGFEPIETVRALPYMSASTTVFMNTTPVMPYVLAQAAVRGKGEGEGDYPDLDFLQDNIRSVTQKIYAFDATELARRSGLVKTLNIVMAGCLVGYNLLPVTPEEFEKTVVKAAPSGLAEANRSAFLLGVATGSGMRRTEEDH